MRSTCAPFRSFLATFAGAAILCDLAAAQQFLEQPGAFPGADQWTEGLECADVDNDGDLDVFFAEGEGFSSAGPKRQNKLILNRFVPSGVLFLQDVSVTRLGVNLSNAKGVTTGDIDGDGFIDALFANGFNTDPPFLYHNRGAASPGFFDLESASRGLTEALSSASAQFGDSDDDGDLDLMITDSGNDFLMGPGGVPRLYQNDGAGFYTEIPGNLATVAKQGHRDAQFVDFDRDWDLDYFGTNLQSNGGVNHFLLQNDGSGSFSDSSNLLPTTSTNCYESDLGDLDGDGDIDIYYVSLSGFSEGPQLNQLVESGSLGFLSGSPAGGEDDNEICLFDYDMDGDYDAYVGSLGTGSDKIMRNNGSASFAEVSGVINGPTDPTLDCTAADLDNDGDYDLITSQGEGNQPQWANKLYLNTGPADTRAPFVTGVDTPELLGSGNVLTHATVRDQVMDDGKDWVTGRVSFVEIASPQLVDVVYDGVSFTPGLLNVTSGTTVRWTNNSAIPETLIGTVSPYDLGTVIPPNGGTASFTFIEPGSYAYLGASAGGGQIDVTGSPTVVDGLRAGVGYWRAELPTGGGAFLCFEWQFTDWAGNLGIGGGQCFQTEPAYIYCTAKTNGLGCVPQIAASGTPSETDPNPFDVSATLVLNFRNGLFFYGYAPDVLPFLSATLCATPPLRRTTIQNAGGTAPPADDCSGTYTIDMNALIQSGVDPFLVAGAAAYGQFWSRDPLIADGTGAGLTDAVALTVQP